MSTDHVSSGHVLRTTPGQTVGPFFNYGLIYPGSHEVVGADAPGAIRVHGHVLDGAGVGVPDALIEIWQPAPDGSVITDGGHIARDGSFTGFGRAETDTEGYFWFRTLEPAVADGAAFFAVTVLARGLLDRLFTRAYLPGEATASDAFLAGLPAEDRATLIAVREEDGSLRFDIRLQGEGETVFLAFPHQRQGSSNA